MIPPLTRPLALMMVAFAATTHAHAQTTGVPQGSVSVFWESAQAFTYNSIKVSVRHTFSASTAWTLSSPIAGTIEDPDLGPLAGVSFGKIVFTGTLAGRNHFATTGEAIIPLSLAMVRYKAGPNHTGHVLPGDLFARAASTWRTGGFFPSLATYFTLVRKSPPVAPDLIYVIINNTTHQVDDVIIAPAP